MNSLISKVDIAFLPDKVEDPIEFMNSVNLKKLNEAYAFCNYHGARSFCTYPELINWIESKTFKTKLCVVIDFPHGDSLSEEKIFAAGRAYELCKKSSSAELDIVLEETQFGAEEDIKKFYLSGIYRFINIKFIIELGNRDPDSTKYVITALNNYRDGVKYIKTNTGKQEPISFEQKIQYAERIRQMTNIPIKVSGNIKTWEQMERCLKVLGDNTIFGVGYDSILKFKE